MSHYVPMLAHRGSVCLGFIHGPPTDEVEQKFSGEPGSYCKDMTFTKDGSLIAWSNSMKVKIVHTSTYEPIQELDQSKVLNLDFSPKGTYISTWGPYTVQSNQKESCNLHIWSVKEGTCLKSFIQKKPTNWKPEWTDSEELCARNVSNEVHFYEKGNFDTVCKKIYMTKVVAFSLSPGLPDHHVACFVPGVKGQPSTVKMFKYPVFDGAQAVVGQKSFFKCDRVEFYWNKTGKNLIVQSSVDVDKSGASYYGEQNLYFFSTKGDASKVMLGKEGPIYSLKWNPDSQTFCVVYGYMPAKATIYNLDCNPLFDFGTGPRNEVHYSLLGNRLILCGFGNLRGHIEVWDLKDKKQISKFMATDTTGLEWCPDSELVLTSTVSPRLRLGNGYRIWHYTGSLLTEKFLEGKDELWDIRWVPVSEENMKESATQYAPIPSISSSQAVDSKEVYRPPGARGQPSKFKLHDLEAPKDLTQKNSTPVDSQQPMSKNKKKNLAKKNKKEQEKVNAGMKELEEFEPLERVPLSQFSFPDSGPSGDPEKDKKVKNLLKKLDQIKNLKQMQTEGKTLEKNQVEKIQKEASLLEELESLTL